MKGAPAGRQGQQHSHRLDGLGMSQRSANPGYGLDIRLIRFLGELVRQQVCHQTAANEQRDGDGSDKAKKRMQKEKRAEKNRRPGSVQGRAHRRRGEETSQFRDVPKRLGCARQALIDRGLNGGGEDRHVQPANERAADGLERERTDEFQNTEHHQGADGQDDEHGKRVHALAVEHPVMNLQHE